MVIFCIVNINIPVTSADKTDVNWTAQTIDWKPDGSYALVGYSGGMVAKYMEESFEYEFIDQMDVMQIAWKPDGSSALVVGYGGILKYNGILNPLSVGDNLNYLCVDWNFEGSEALIGGYITGEFGETIPSLLKYDGVELIDITGMIESEPDLTVRHISWAPDRDLAMIYTSSGKLYEYKEGVMSLKTQINNFFDMEWAPDGSRLLFLDNTLALYSWDDVSGPFQLTELASGKKNYNWNFGKVSVKSDGTGVIFSGYNENYKISKIYSFNESKQLIEEFKNIQINDIEWHPSGEYVIAVGSYTSSGGVIKKVMVEKKVETPSMLPLIVTLSLGPILTFLYVGFTETGRYRFLKFLIVPFLVRIRKRNPLENQMRDVIYRYIEHNPGENYTKIKKTLGLANGTLVYHLKILTKEDMIKSISDGRYKRFYPKDSDSFNGNNIYEFDGTQMLTEIQRRILKKIVEKPQVSKAEMARSLGVSRQLLNYHLNKLVKVGLVKVKGKGKSDSTS
jgi:predicted transcriptional regulator